MTPVRKPHRNLTLRQVGVVGSCGGVQDGLADRGGTKSGGMIDRGLTTDVCGGDREERERKERGFCFSYCLVLLFHPCI